MEVSRSDGGSPYPFAVDQTLDSGYIILQGGFGSPLYVAKTDRCGRVDWDKYLPNDHQEGFHYADLTPTSDSGYVVVSDYEDAGWQWCVRKLAADGAIVLDSAFVVGPEYDQTYPCAVKETADSGIVIAGGGLWGYYLLKFASSDPLVLEFQRAYNLPGVNAMIFDMELTNEGGFLLAGTFEQFGDAGYDFSLIKTDPDGTLEWPQTFDAGGDEWAFAVAESDLGGYIAVGAQLPWEGLAHVVKFLGCCVLRGDVNHDGVGPNIIDLTVLIDYVLEGGPQPPCLGNGDLNADGDVNIVDVTYLVAHLFAGGPLPEPCP